MPPKKFDNTETVATCTLTTSKDHLIVTTKGNWGTSPDPLKPGSRCRISNGKARAA